jgi:hypothetical protein
MNEDEDDTEETSDDDDTSKLEAEFQKVYDDHNEEICEQLRIANAAIGKAEELSEKYGLPFDAGVSPLRQAYWPNSYSDKFGELDTDFVGNVTDCFSEYHEGGWEHSAVCW